MSVILPFPISDSLVAMCESYPYTQFTSGPNECRVPREVARSVIGALPQWSSVRPVPNAITNLQIQLRDNQTDVYREANDLLEQHGSVTLACYTGFGKTMVSLKLAAERGGRVMIVCPGYSFIHHWYKYFQSQAHVLGQSLRVLIQIDPQRMEGPLDADVYIVMPATIRRLKGSSLHGILESITTLIIDEVHTFNTFTSSEAIALVVPKYIIAASATYEHRNSGVMEQYIGRYIVEHLSTESYEFTFCNLGLACDLEKYKTNTLDSKLFGHDISIGRKVDVLRHLVRDGRRILCLSYHMAIAKKVYGQLHRYGVKCALVAGIDIKIQGHESVICGTFHGVGTGFDYASSSVCAYGEIDTVMIDASVYKSELIQQSIGRVMRAKSRRLVVVMTQPGVLYEKRCQLIAKECVHGTLIDDARFKFEETPLVEAEPVSDPLSDLVTIQKTHPDEKLRGRFGNVIARTADTVTVRTIFGDIEVSKVYVR